MQIHLMARKNIHEWNSAYTLRFRKYRGDARLDSAQRTCGQLMEKEHLGQVLLVDRLKRSFRYSFGYLPQWKWCKHLWNCIESLPGFAPCAILISSCSALTMNWGVTPKRPEATCLIRDVTISPFCSPLRWGKVGERPSASTSSRFFQREGSSPPSPELLLPAESIS